VEVRVLVGGGPRRSLDRVLSRCSTLPHSFDSVTSQDGAGVWKRKAAHADIAVVRTGCIGHKAWLALKAQALPIVPVPLNGDDALVAALHDLQQKHAA